jgi:hypothetical protein
MLPLLIPLQWRFKERREIIWETPILKKLDPVDVVYQAAGAASGIVVTMEVYDAAGVKNEAMSGTMTEIGNKGRYKKSFTPNTDGGWVVLISDANGGKSVGSYGVGNTNIESLGAAIASSDDKIAAADTKVVTVTDKVDALTAKVDSIPAPPMIG